MVTNLSPTAQSHWSLYLMLGAWASVEVPRYLYYALALLGEASVPYPLLWLRYSLFVPLYPLGITAELLQLTRAMPDLRPLSLGLWYLCALALCLYLPGSPFLYFHMLTQRKAALAKRLPVAVPKPAEGIEFPVTDPATGERSTQVLGRNAFAASARAVSKTDADKVEAEQNWRFRYNRHVKEHVRLALAAPEDAVKMARAGLEYMHSAMEFRRGSEVMSMSQAMRHYKGSFHMGVIQGSLPRPTKPQVAVPYKDQMLTGADLEKQLDRWVAYGTIEPEAREAIALAARSGAWLDLSSRYFVLLGARSAMGPLQVLLSLGANVIALDIDREPAWKQLLEQTRASCGRLIFPLKKPQAELPTDADLAQNAGCNLATHTPEVANWVCGVEPEQELVVGGYAYLDGAMHVKVSLAMDAVMAECCARRAKGLTLAFLCTPTDCHVITKQGWEAAKRQHAAAPLWQKALEALGVLRRNTERPITSRDGKHTYYIVDSLAVGQGPNYALAKRMQHWRAVVARAQGVSVSSNVAPSTATKSVISNKQFAAAYVGLYLFKPMEVMMQETSVAVMGLTLIHDVCNPQGKAKAAYPLTNPLELFSLQAFHGGTVRGAYQLDSIGPPSYLWGVLLLNKPQVAAALSVLVGALAAAVAYPPHTLGFL